MSLAVNFFIFISGLVGPEVLQRHMTAANTAPEGVKLSELETTRSACSKCKTDELEVNYLSFGYGVARSVGVQGSNHGHSLNVRLSLMSKVPCLRFFEASHTHCALSTK